MSDIQVIKYVLCTLLVAAGLAKSVADAQAHGSPKLARWFPRWAGPEAWRLKWKGGEKTNGPAFPGSSTVLVFLTDLWHFSNFLLWACADAAFLLAAWPRFRWWAVGAVLARRLVFEGPYKWLRV